MKNKFNIGDVNIPKEVLIDTFNKFKDLDLTKHYNFDEKIICTIEDQKDAINLVKSNRPLKFRIGEGNMLYYELNESGIEELFDIDFESSFSISDTWLSDKLISISNVFPNVANVDISNEMVSFYCCIVIASVMGGEFEEQFFETCSSYNFKTWTQEDISELTMFELNTEWIQIGSIIVKMIASAAKFELMREKKKTLRPSALGLPEDVALRYGKYLEDISACNKSWTVTGGELSPENMRKMTRLQIKNAVKERDDQLNILKKSDLKMYQIYRLSKLNSNNIEPNLLLKIKRTCRKDGLKEYFRITGKSELPATNEERFHCKAIENKLRRETIRAAINRMFAIESEKFRSNPDTYIAPDFV